MWFGMNFGFWVVSVIIVGRFWSLVQFSNFVPVGRRCCWFRPLAQSDHAMCDVLWCGDMCCGVVGA